MGESLIPDERVRSVFQSHALLAKLAGSVLGLAASATMIGLEPAEFLYAEGDEPDASYVIVSGDIELTAQGNGASTAIRLAAGSMFGECRTIGPARLPRAESARALGAATLARIPLPPQQHSAEPAETHPEIQINSLAGQFPTGSFGKIAHRRRAYRAGDVVFRQGETADDVFIVEHGTAHILMDEHGQQVRIAQVGPGGFFGERGVMRAEPRAATVMAASDLDVLVLDGGGFREQVGQSEKAQEFLSAVESVYQLPRRGLVVQGETVLDGIPAVTSSYTLNDSRAVLVARATHGGAVVFRHAPMPDDVTWLVSAAAPAVRLGLHGDRLSAIEARQDWPGLPAAAVLVLDGTTIEPWRLALFRATGVLEAEAVPGAGAADELVCGCMAVRRRALASYIAAEAEVDVVAKATGASTVCGSCRPRLIELLGGEGMIPARIAERRVLTPEIHSFRIVGREKVLAAARPGQHVVLDGMIGGAWVRRSYTLVGHLGGADGLEVAVRRNDAGVFSPWLFDGGDDMLLRASAPAGSLKFGDGERRIVAIVAGIGVTPAVALARGIAAGRLPPRPLTVHHSARTRDTAAFAGEFEARAARGELDYRLWLTAPQGRLAEREVTALVAEHRDAVFLVCGPAAFERAVINQLAAAGVSGNEVIVESFLSGTEAPAVEAKPSLPPVCPVAHPPVATLLDAPADATEEATNLLRQLHSEGWLSEQALASRLPAVVPGQAFEPMAEELAWAARLAWRNSTRCIGRLYWKSLHVLDRRDASGADAVLDAMVAHLELATNGGRLRSMLTVLPALHPGMVEILSPQLVRYAGYRQADGSIVGDPAHLELTELAAAQGWRGRGTAFDVLPLLVRDAEGHVHMRELTPQQVLEVPLTHPHHAWFAELALKWHALPAIANTFLDAFGRAYPVIFNGWYMGTEIGARNLSDAYRYNLLPRLAQRLGLDRSSEGTLWRDRALVELNVAVLHSFRQAGVTMLDHHQASKEFLEFVGQEHACGRTANTDWSWVVPPMSASTVPQFHLDLPNQRLKPAFVERPDALRRVDATVD